MKSLIKIIIMYTGIVFYILNSNPVQSCNVPVFRYALERWPSEPYEVIVFHRGPLSIHDRSDVEWLENLPENHIPYANFKVRIINLESKLSGSMHNLLETIKSHELPCLVLRYPVSTRIKKIIWSGHLERDAVHRIVDSPVR
ncbi:MAG TPA: hypothetical protein ENH82_04855, partial [bacterium]|nr:hypothetical protein [bacterium]